MEVEDLNQEVEILDQSKPGTWTTEPDEKDVPSSHSPSNTSHIFKKFQKLYTKQLKEADGTSDGLKLKVKILENWVKDLTEQNEMLVKTVDELESEALQHLSTLEAHYTQAQEVQETIEVVRNPATNNSSHPRELCPQIETLCRELEQMKKQLTDKENLISKYQSRIEELSSRIEGEKTDDSVLAHYSNKVDSICEQDRNVQPSVYRDLETTRLQLSQVEKEVTQLKKKLKDTESNTKRLRSDLVASDKNAKEMRAALTAEVAEKHDQILALRREVNQLEEQLRQADMQTHFKDDIIKELRKEVKVARSKETLVEVLGIKERSLSHLEHLTEQLEQKDQVINCLKQQLTQGSADLLYRVRQQVDWFTENVTQQCNQGNCSEEFKKCITTMLEELKESIECCNLGPSDTTELSKESIKFVSTIQKSLEKSKKDLNQSWSSISETVQQMNKMDMSPLMDQWKKSLCKQKSLQRKLQEAVRSIINITSSSNGNVESVTKSMDALQCLLFRFTDELNSQPRERSFTGWLKNLQCVVTELISKIKEITEIISDIRSNDDESHSDLVSKMHLVDKLQWELSDALCSEMKAYENLCRKEKTQRVNVDSLLATVLHHQEIWNQQVSLTDDLMKEILRLTNNLNQKSVPNQANQIPLEERSINLQSLVSKISADIRNSLCNIEQRQNQVSHLELDLSSVKLVLEAAQQEIEEISKTCNTQDMRHKVNILLLKLKKQIANALTKAENLVKTYANTKQEFISSSERILQLQKEWDTLEQEVRHHWTQIREDFKKPPKTARGFCPNQEVLAAYEQNDFKKPPKTSRGLCPNQAVLAAYEQNSHRQPLLKQYKSVQKALQSEDAAIKIVKGNVMDLKSIIKDRDKLSENQEKTICVLQNSLRKCHNEAEELRRTIDCLEVKKCEIETENKKKIQELECKISKLQNCLKKHEESNKNQKKNEAALKLVIAELKENISELENNVKLSEDTRSKQHKSEAALQLVIANLKETIFKERRRCSETEKENVKLREQVKELEDCCKNTSKTNQEIADLKKQVNCWSEQASELEEQLKKCQGKLCKSLQREKELEQELSSKDLKCKEEIGKKQKEINELSKVMQSLTQNMNASQTELVATRMKTCEAEMKWQSLCNDYEELKLKEKEKEAQVEKLQAALTQLSNKFVSRRLDPGTSQCVRHYQEECAKYEALYNTSACKLRSKEMEVASLKQELERLRKELDHVAMTTSQQKEDESCPFLMERVHQLSKELQVAHSCQNSYESMLKDIREKYSKKEEENFHLKTQMKQIALQRDTVISDLEEAQQEINRLTASNCNLQTTIKRLEQNNAHVSEQLHKAVYESEHSAAAHLQPNIELQREISTALTSQLRGVKQKLHTTKHDYKLLQTAYEDLNRKYTMLQRGERDLEHVKEIVPVPKLASQCRPCLAKSSKSVTYIKMPEKMGGQDHVEYLSQSKSWHKMENKKESDWGERKWKQKIQEIIRGDFDSYETRQHSSSSN